MKSHRPEGAMITPVLVLTTEKVRNATVGCDPTIESTRRLRDSVTDVQARHSVSPANRDKHGALSIASNKDCAENGFGR